VESGPLRTIQESRFAHGRSELTLRTISYSAHPWIEFQIRLHWHEKRKRLKLAIPTVLRGGKVTCEIPGGAIERPADGQEYLQGRWMVVGSEGEREALALINTGQHGCDVLDGEIRLSVLRSVPYAFEHTQTLQEPPEVKVMDQGVHELRLLVSVGPREDLLRKAASLAEWLNAPPYALAHYPLGAATPARQELLVIGPSNLRLIACKRSWDGGALVLRIQESAGVATEGTLRIETPAISARVAFEPFALKTFRIEREGAIREVPLIEEA
jgi:alpha-mannosidase